MMDEQQKQIAIIVFFTTIGLIIGNLLAISAKENWQRFAFQVVGITIGNLLAMASKKYLFDEESALDFLD